MEIRTGRHHPLHRRDPHARRCRRREGAIDAAPILKPMLARGELQTIGATTPRREYRKHLEKDAALERRFQPVKEEPTVATPSRS
jgi:ATP-dependent Clp protease ATP-binding subunit ClpA